ncbi:MAG: hypothetical protein J6W75_07605 [Bacteroidaceae bacterium]|nr:hypothetical protein [Bacteroidaceae bacterium]
MRTAIYTLTSELHNEQAVNAATQEFLDSLHLDCDFCGDDFSDYGHHSLDLIYVRTGGTEGIFLRLLPELLKMSDRPFRLLTSGKSNSLAASMEILSYLRQHHLQGEILHGSPQYISSRIHLLAKSEDARRSLKGTRLGVVGKPSDWLISSDVDAELVKQKFGIELVQLPLPTIEEAIDGGTDGAMRIYQHLQELVRNNQLQGFTIRCFDLLKTLHNTGCLALAKLNAEGIVAGCEGDVPALLSMAFANAITGVSGFQANPARIDPETGELLFAHCTIPLNMVERYDLDTHFESGIGVGIRGYMKPESVTIFKLAPDLSTHFVAEGQLVRNQAAPDLCRTQQVIQLDDPQQARYFLTRPIGSHHIIMPGQQKKVIEAILGEC